MNPNHSALDNLSDVDDDEDLLANGKLLQRCGMIETYEDAKNFYIYAQKSHSYTIAVEDIEDSEIRCVLTKRLAKAPHFLGMVESAHGLLKDDAVNLKFTRPLSLLMCLIWYNQNLGLNLTPIQLHMKSFSTP
jgi:hypothetical protein